MVVGNVLLKILALCLSYYSVNGERDTLRFVSVVFRHGDHGADVIGIPNVPASVRAPNPYHSLSQLGIVQAQQLGSFLRKRYVETGFLSETYNATEIYVRSQDNDLAISSGYYNLEALYPPSEKTEWMKGMGYQLIPVHSVPLADDYILFVDHVCPTAESLTVLEIVQTVHPNMVPEARDLLNYLQKKSGQQITTYIEFNNYHKILLAQKTLANMSWPAYMNDKLYNRTDNLFTFARNNYFRVKWVTRFRGAPLFLDIAERSLNKTKFGSAMTLKYYGYVTIAATMMGLFESWGIPGTYHGKSPLEGSAIMVELHEQQKEYYVEVHYLFNSTNTTALHMPIKVCGEKYEYQCPLDIFVKHARREAPNGKTAWFTECGLWDPKNEQVKKLTAATEILGMTTAATFILLFGTLIYFLCCQKSGRRHYKQID